MADQADLPHLPFSPIFTHQSGQLELKSKVSRIVTEREISFHLQLSKKMADQADLPHLPFSPIFTHQSGQLELKSKVSRIVTEREISFHLQLSHP